MQTRSIRAVLTVSGAGSLELYAMTSLEGEIRTAHSARQPSDARRRVAMAAHDGDHGASIITGIGQSLGTACRLFRHYWVIPKLPINILSTAILRLLMRPIALLAELATGSETSPTPL